MGALLGPVGGLEKVASPTTEPVEWEPRITFREYVSGRRQVQMWPAPPRDWACSENTVSPEDAALLQWMAGGHRFDLSNGLVWYSSYSQVTNMLTPEESFMGDGRKPGWTGGSVAGAGVTADKTRYLLSRTASPGETIRLTEPLPVPGQRDVTVSAYITSYPGPSATLRVVELDPMGDTVGTHPFTVPSDTHALRAAVSFTTSLRTDTLRIEVVGANMVTMPAVTLTRTVQPWAPGRGCRRAMIILTGETPQLAFEVPNDWGRRHAQAFTIHEIG